MNKINASSPYGIDVPWATAYLCKRCGDLIYYSVDTKTEYCFNAGCPDYPNGIELFGTEEADLKVLKNQYSQIEKNLGQMVRTCDYKFLARSLMKMRSNIVNRFFTSGKLDIDRFLTSNDILAFIRKHRSFGIRKDSTILTTIVGLYKRYTDILKTTENLKEGRYVLSKVPPNKLYKLKYYDVILEEVWPSYGLINITTMPNIDDFRYHDVIQKLVDEQRKITTTDCEPLFDNLWPFSLGFQYLIKRDYATSLKYKYPVTPTDLANILSVIWSLKDNNVTTLPIMKLLLHFIAQPVREKDFIDFIAMLAGDSGNAPILFEIDGEVILDRRTMLLFFILLNNQRIASFDTTSGRQALNQHKEQAGKEYEAYLQGKLQERGFHCLPCSTKIADRDYDQIAVSESKQEILLVEAKFKDPSPSSFSKHTLIDQEFTTHQYGLLPQAKAHQNRYDLLFQKSSLFEKKLGLRNKISNYCIKAYLVTKYTPLINSYCDVRIMSEQEFSTTVLGALY